MNPEPDLIAATRAAILPWDGDAVTVAYLAFGKTKHAVVCKSAIGNQQLAIRRGLTATGAERVANRVNAVALAVHRLG